MATFEIDEDIRRARTLPSTFYTDADCFEEARSRVFAESCQFVCHRDEVGTLFPRTLLPGILDEPILVVRRDGSFIGLSNVCTHRGNILVDQPCKADLIKCGYHGRRFSLDGKCLSMPEFELVEGFPSSDDDLRKVSIDEWNGFLFARAGSGKLADLLADVEPLETWGCDPLRLTQCREYEVNAHWALYCENYLEGFHVPFVHHELNRTMDYRTYSTQPKRYSSIQIAYDPRGQAVATYLFIFPNTMLNFYPWGISVNIVKPVSRTLTTVEFRTYVGDESLVGRGAGADLDSVELEDEAVVERVQIGIRSRFYDRGRYSPTKEKGTHHFHRLVAECMR